MSILLRIALSAFFIGMAVLVYLYPQPTKEYLDNHYKAFYGAFIAETAAAKFVPGTLVASAPCYCTHVMTGALAVTGLLSLIGVSCLFKLLGITFTLAAAALHIPTLMASMKSDAPEGALAGEVKKMLFIAAIFCGILAYKGCICCCCCKGKKCEPAPKEKDA